MEDVLDSRDVIARIEELRGERDDLKAESESESDTDHGAAVDAWIEWKESDEAEELKILEALAEDGKASPDWPHGETMIRDSYFEDYAQELAEDIGAINNDSNWPNNCIDWEQAARELRMDYTGIEFGGVDYWIRS